MDTAAQFVIVPIHKENQNEKSSADTIMGKSPTPNAQRRGAT